MVEVCLLKCEQIISFLDCKFNRKHYTLTVVLCKNCLAGVTYSMRNDAVPTKTDETQSHMEDVAVPDTLHLAG